MDKRFRTEHTIGYLETDGRLMWQPSFLVGTLQDVAIRHSDSLGYTMEYLAEKKRGWAIINWHIQILRHPVFNDTMQIETWSERCRRMQANRSYIVMDSAGEPMLRVASRWIYMDLEGRKPAAIGKEMEESYGNSDIGAISGEKYTLPKPAADTGYTERRFTVTRRDTDNNGHANNVKYIEWAMDDVPDKIYDRMRLVDLKVVYRKECYRNSDVCARTFVEENGDKAQVICFLLDDVDGAVLAEVASVWEV